MPGNEARAAHTAEGLTSMDNLSRKRRSQNMRAIRSKDTSPEMAVRKLVHGLGYRYRLHGSKLPGKPDLVFAGRRKVIFIHGCFWHLHRACREGRIPGSRQAYWKPKLEGNRTRDLRRQRELRQLGWGVMVIWECQVESGRDLSGRIRRFLGPAGQ